MQFMAYMPSNILFQDEKMIQPRLPLRTENLYYFILASEGNLLKTSKIGQLIKQQPIFKFNVPYLVMLLFRKIKDQQNWSLKTK